MANPHRGVASVGLGRDPGSGNHGVLIKRHHREWDPSCKVFIGGLRDAPTRCRFDIEFHFSDVGKVKDVWVSERPPGFAYVEMESEKDAIKSVKQLNGMFLGGGRVTVEISRHIDDKKQDRERRLKKWDKVNDRVKQEQARGNNYSDLGEGSSRGGRGRSRERRSPIRERRKSRGRKRSRSRRSMVRGRSGSQDLHTEIGVSLATKEFQDKQGTRGAPGTRGRSPYVKEKRRWGSRERRSQSREKWFKFFSFKKDGVVEKEQEMKKIKKRQEGAARKLHPEEYEQSSSSRTEYCGRDVRGSSREARRRSRSKDGRLFDVRQEDQRRREQEASRVEEAKKRILHIAEAQKRDLEEGRSRSEERRRSRDRSRSSSEEGRRSRSREGTKINYTSNFSSILRKREEEAEAREASRERRRQRGRKSRSRSRTPSPSSCARLPPHLLGGWVPTG